MSIGIGDVRFETKKHDFQTLLLSVLPSLRRQALALTRHQADAEDLVQAAVESALAAADSFRTGTNFNAWITRILRNRFFSNVRLRRVTVDLDDVPPMLISRNGNQEYCLEVADLRRQLLRLPEEQRVILLMISIGGISYDDAALQLGVAKGTLKCRVFRARAQLHNWMTGVEGRERVAHELANRRIPMIPPPAARHHASPTNVMA